MLKIELPKVCYDPRMTKHPGCGNASYALFEQLHAETLIDLENTLREAKGVHPIPKTKPALTFTSPFGPYIAAMSAINFAEGGTRAFFKTYRGDVERNLDKTLLTATEAGVNTVQRRMSYAVLLPIVARAGQVFGRKLINLVSLPTKPPNRQ